MSGKTQLGTMGELKNMGATKPGDIVEGVAGGHGLKPLSLLQLMNLSVGIIGIQFAWSLQIALSSRVLEPLGADPFLFGLIWCAGPLTGLLVQPIIGSMSDNTWTFMGRRRPYILAGALLGALCMYLFPHASSLWMATVFIWLIDAAINCSQGPYRALVPDRVPPQQQAVANSFMNFAFGAGYVISMGISPLLRNFGVQLSVTQQYTLAAIALVFLVLYTIFTVKEYAKRPKALVPNAETTQATMPEKKRSFFSAWQVFFSCSREVHKICITQFFTWLGLMCMFIYLTPFIVHNIYQIPDLSTPDYKRMEALNQVLAPMLSGKISQPQQEQQIYKNYQQVKRTFPADQFQDAQLTPWVYSIGNSTSQAVALPVALVGQLQTDLAKYQQLNQQLDQRIPTVLRTKAGYTTAEQQALLAVAQLDPGVKIYAQKLADLSHDQPANLQQRAEQFKDLSQQSEPVQALLRSNQVFMSPAGRSDLRLVLEQSQQLAMLKNVVRYKELVLTPHGFNLPGVPVHSVGYSAKAGAVVPAVAGDPAVEILARDLQKVSFLKHLEEEAVNTAQISLVAFNAICLILSIPLGFLCNRLGKKRIYTISLLFLSVAFAFAPFIGTPEQVILMMTVAGVAWSTILSIPFAILGEHIPHGEEGSVMGIFNMFIAGPQLISATVIGWIISQSPRITLFGISHDWSIAFVVASVFVFLSILVLQTIHEKKPGMGQPLVGGTGH